MQDRIDEARKELLLDYIRRNADDSRKSLNWCFTTLAALNGGAIVSLIGIDRWHDVVATNLFWFGAGLLLSVLASLFASYASEMWSATVANGLWSGEAIRADFLEDVINANSQGSVANVLSFLAALGSALLLIAGAVVTISAVGEV